jgi:transposase
MVPRIRRRNDQETRRNHSAAFKAKVALAAIKGDKKIQQLTDHFGIHASQISRLCFQLVLRPNQWLS